MPPAPPRAAWPVPSLAVMSLAVFLSITTELLPTGLLPAMSRSLDVSPGKLGLLVTAYALVVAVLAAPLGIATARVPRRRLLALTMMGYAISNTIMALSSSYPLAIGARLIGGFSHALFWATLGGYVARMVTPERMGRAVTLVSSGGLLAVLFGVPAGTALGVAIGWRPTYAALAVAPVLLIAAGWRWLPDLPGTPGGSGQRIRQVARIPGLAPVVAATAVTMLGQFTFSTYVAPFLLHAGLTEQQVSPVLLGSGIAGGLGLLAAGFFVDRRLRAGMLLATALLGTALAILAFGPTSAALAAAGICMTGVAMGSIPVFLQTATLGIAPGATDAASGLNASSFNIGIAGGALLGGVTIDQFGPAALPIIAAALVGAGFLIIASTRLGLPQPSPTERGVPAEPVGVHAAE